MQDPGIMLAIMGGKRIDWTKDSGARGKGRGKRSRRRKRQEGSRRERSGGGSEGASRTERLERPSPWSNAELAKIVEAACRFIAQAKSKHGRAFGWEVGKYLYRDVYKGDEAYIEWRHPGKDDSLRDIARRSGVPYGTLHGYLRAYMTRLRMERAGFTSALSMKHMEEIAELSDVEAMAAIARWVEENKVSSVDLPGIVERWKEHIAGGGALEDLVEWPEPRKRKRGRASRPRARELVVPRLFEMAGGWARGARMHEDKRSELRRLVLRLRARITGATR